MKIVADYIIRIIQALSTVGIVGLLIYFFIYYRQPMKSILEALGDIDILKWGKRGEFKRRALNKLIEATKSEIPPKSESITEQSSNSQISKDDHIKQLEFDIGILNKQLLGTTTVAATTTSDLLNSENVQILENIREQARDYVMEKQPDSDLLKLADSYMRSCLYCKWGTQMSIYDVQIDEDPFYAGLGYVKCEKDQQKHLFNDSCDKWETRPG